MKYFQDKKILLTGAAGGFGGEFIKQLLPLGAKLVLTDINEETLRKVASEHQAAVRSAGEIIGVLAADLASDSECKRLHDDCVKMCGDVDILINNAGILTFGNFHEHPEEVIKKVVAVNLLAPMFLTRLFLQEMTARGSGHIVMVASLASVIPTAYETAYSATKCAMRGFGMALEREVSKLGVAVTNIYPNWADTNMLNAKRYGSVKVKRVSSFMIDKPEMVIRRSIRGIARKRLHVFPGLQATLYSQAAQFWPIVYENPLE